MAKSEGTDLQSSAMLHPRQKGEHLEEEDDAMKNLLIGLLFLAGCTNVPQQTAETQPVPDPLKKTYTSEEMRKTGRQTVGGQLEQIDPSVTVRH
jgi:starvation-inducible outer membrane lipoprotein